MCELTLQNRSSYPELQGSQWRSWLSELLMNVAPDAASLGIRFCGRRAMRGAQRQFRERDSVTDVLSFPGDPADHLGDILICVPKAREQAVDDVALEIRRLLLHGILHCLGYDHESDEGQMIRLERGLRRRWIEL